LVQATLCYDGDPAPLPKKGGRATPSDGRRPNIDHAAIDVLLYGRGHIPR